MQRPQQNTTPPNMSPVNPIPPVVLALFLAIVVIEAAFSLGAAGMVGGPAAVGWRQAAVQDYGFNGQILDWMMAQGVWPPEHLIRFVTYPFLHGNFTHALFAGAMLLALGKMVGEVFSPLATLAVFFVSCVAGAAAFGLLLDETTWLIGAFPGVYGLIGAFTFLLWLRLGRTGENQYRAFLLIGGLLFIQLVFGVLFGGSRDWLADVTGFVAGFGLSFLVAPGAWTRLRARMRER